MGVGLGENSPDHVMLYLSGGRPWRRDREVLQTWTSELARYTKRSVAIWAPAEPPGARAHARAQPSLQALRAAHPLCSAVTPQQWVWAEMLPALPVGSMLSSPISQNLLSFCRCLPQHRHKAHIPGTGISFPHFPAHMYNWGLYNITESRVQRIP